MKGTLEHEITGANGVFGTRNLDLVFKKQRKLFETESQRVELLLGKLQELAANTRADIKNTM